MTEAARHLVQAGSKRFRPLLVLLAAQFGDPHAPGVLPSAVVVELTHLATLYHDDDGDLTDDDRHAEALQLLRAHPAMEAARADWSGPGTRGACSSRCPTYPPGGLSRPSATPSSAAPPEPGSRTA
jgi:hypothetical protein